MNWMAFGYAVLMFMSVFLTVVALSVPWMMKA